MTTIPRYAPALSHIEIEGVRLYNDGESLKVDLDTPISAFVGANGIGKSTLLALVNFALTGLVPNPSASFQSVDEFAERTSMFAAAYFNGRVDEEMRDTATVKLAFSLGDRAFEVTRGLFEGRLVRSFSERNSLGGTVSDGSDAAKSQSDLAFEYQEAIVEASGLANFEQFTFWQLFLMTFDERRHLLFWDERTLQSALLISLGRSPQDAIEAESLSRNIERQDSLARNARWRATQATNRRSRLNRTAAKTSDVSDTEFLDLQLRRESLESNNSDAKRALEQAELSLRDSSRSVAELAIEESTTEQKYLAAFSTPHSERDPWRHPVITGISQNGLCDVCGSVVHKVSPRVEALLNSGTCPICDSQFNITTIDHEDHSTLLALDAELAATRRRLEDARATYHRLRDEAAKAAERWDAASRELDEFLSINSTHLAPSKAEYYTDQILQLDREISGAMQEAEEHRQNRDKFRDQLDPIISALVSGYDQIEKIFVPNFRRLAEQFIGRAVDVEFERKGIAVGLRFALDGQSRRSPSELSESQQYFLDIALRMSLIQTFISASCSMLIDTPEGSLDIAYETRAGMLFDQFSSSGYSIFMLSNLNASNLLSELAGLAGKSRMRIFKMIEWSKLSEVQLESAALFDREYDRLDQKLEQGHAVS